MFKHSKLQNLLGSHETLLGIIKVHRDKFLGDATSSYPLQPLWRIFFFPQGGRGYVRYCRHLKHLLEERAALSLAFNRSKDNLDQR